MIYVCTTNDDRSNQTDTAGAFTDLAEAKRCTEVTIEAIANPHAHGFVEAWDGGEFQAHYELRGQPERPAAYPDDGTRLPATWEWWVAEGPAFAPIKDTTDTTKEN